MLLAAAFLHLNAAFWSFFLSLLLLLLFLLCCGRNVAAVLFGRKIVNLSFSCGMSVFWPYATAFNMLHIFIYSFLFYLFYMLKTLNWLLSMANRATNALTGDTNAWRIPTLVRVQCKYEMRWCNWIYQLRNKVAVAMYFAKEINACDLSIVAAQHIYMYAILYRLQVQNM